jgi:hypothetical protein
MIKASLSLPLPEGVIRKASTWKAGDEPSETSKISENLAQDSFRQVEICT